MIDKMGKKVIYNFNIDSIEKILDFLENCEFYDINVFSQEKLRELIELIYNFFLCTKIEYKDEFVQVKETESEARDYFGSDFIKQFDLLQEKLFLDETVLSVHGTLLEYAKEILNSGLKYKSPSLTSTSVIQDTKFDGNNHEYNDYAGLLNWKHHNYKALVLIGVPYECFYKEPLWEKFADDYTGTEFTHKIKEEFIIGYIDVLNKKIILNPNYKRNHDYSGLEYDYDIYKEEHINNEEFKKRNITFLSTDKSRKSEDINLSVELNYKEELNFDKVVVSIEELRGCFRGILCSLKLNNNINPDKILELLQEIKVHLEVLKLSTPILKTNEIIIVEYEEKIFSQIDKDLLNKTLMLPNQSKMSAKEYIKRYVMSYILGKDFITLKNGNIIPVTHFLIECVIFDCQERYNGDFISYMNDNILLENYKSL